MVVRTGPYPHTMHTVCPQASLNRKVLPTGIEKSQWQVSPIARVPQPPPRLRRAAGSTVAFEPVLLDPGAKQTVTSSIPNSANQVIPGSARTTVPGTYTVGIGDSSESLPTQTSLVID